MENVTKLMNDFINLDNLIDLAIEKKDYEQAAKLRDKRNELRYIVYINIVQPHIPISVEINFKYNKKNKR